MRALTQTYVGHIGGSAYHSRTDFFANRAAIVIPKMFAAFDDAAASAFVEAIKGSRQLKDRIRHARKLARLRSLANIVSERVSDTFAEQEFLDALVAEDSEERFFELLKT